MCACACGCIYKYVFTWNNVKPFAVVAFQIKDILYLNIYFLICSVTLLCFRRAAACHDFTTADFFFVLSFYLSSFQPYSSVHVANTNIIVILCVFRCLLLLQFLQRSMIAVGVLTSIITTKVDIIFHPFLFRPFLLYFLYKIF